MALSLAVSSLGFQGAAPMGRAAPAVQMSAINVGDIGTTRPLGVWDPLGLMTKMPEKYRRWQVSARAAHSTDTSAALGSSTPAAAPLQRLNMRGCSTCDTETMQACGRSRPDDAMLSGAAVMCCYCSGRFARRSAFVPLNLHH